MNANDWRALRAPLTGLIASIAVGVALPYYTDFKLREARRDLAQQQTAMREARTRLHRSDEEKDIIVRYLGAYQYLQRLGFIGDEQRINWLDGLRVSNQQSQLFGVDYQIATQQPYPYANELNPGQMALYQSVMKISFRLLHEGDLMRFLGTLAQQRVGVFSVNQCVLQRLETGASVRYQPNLRAECELAWITMRPAAAAEKRS